MGTTAGDAGTIGNAVADAVVLGSPSESSKHLSDEAVSLFGDHDFSQDQDFKNAALMDLVNRQLLPGLVWAEEENLDLNHDNIIEQGEANSLTSKGDLFTQLAAEYMRYADHDVSFDEIATAKNQSVSTPQDAQPAGTGEVPTGDTSPVFPVIDDNPMISMDPTQQGPDYMQFSGDSAVPQAAPVSSDAAQNYAAESQFLASQFPNLDTDGDQTVSYPELIAASQNPNPDIANAAQIAAAHHLTELNGGSYTSFTMQDVINDGQPPQNAPEPAPVPSRSPSADLAALTAANSSIEDRLKAVKNLVESGQPPTSITDANGNQLSVRLEEIPIKGSSRSMVQMFATDPATGKEYVVLRAISDGDSFSHQKDKNGQEVDFEGSRWKQMHPDSLFSAQPAAQAAA